MAEQRHDQQGDERPLRGGFAGPRLQLPRFELPGDVRPTSRADAHQARAPHAAPRTLPSPPSFGGGAAFAATPRVADRPRTEQPRAAAPRPSAYVAPQPSAYSLPARAAHPHHAPMTNVAPAHLTTMPIAQHYAPAAPHQYAPAAAPPPPVVPQAAPRIPALTPAATATMRTASTISWERLEAPAPSTSALARIKPVHMGVLMLLVVGIMIIMSGPTAMKVPSTAGVVAGGGTSGSVVEGSGVYVGARAGDTAAAAASTANAAATAKAATAANAAATSAASATLPRAVSTPAVAMIQVGSAEVPRDIRHGGMPSPAAAANLAISGGGRVTAADTGSLQLAGIPSPAAAAKLGPEVLPYAPSDGVTLPRTTGERDSHAVDTHYGGATLPLAEPIETPVMTPGESAARAQHMQAEDQLVYDGVQPSAGDMNRAF